MEINCAVVTNALAVLTLIGTVLLVIGSTAFEIIFSTLFSEISGIFKESIMQMF